MGYCWGQVPQLRDDYCHEQEELERLPELGNEQGCGFDYHYVRGDNMETYYNKFVERSVDAEEIAMMDLDTIAVQVGELISDAQQDDDDYPRNDDGTIDLYEIASAIRQEAERIMKQRET